ncbi:MAG TPA: DEAD/DEAH box helicase [Planctomycetota bacterium]|nr:DEAD/DEAH box helicase [Planctomycetota bacterium]
MKVSVQLRLPDNTVPLSRLKLQGSAIAYNGQQFEIDTLDALLFRNILQQPQADAEGYIIGAREFAPMLALLRQHSANCTYEECERIAPLEILSLPPELLLELKETRADHATGNPQSAIRNPQSVVLRCRFRHPETRAEMGDVLFRGSSYWTFERYVTPLPAWPEDEVLRKCFAGSTPPGGEAHGDGLLFAGPSALDIIQRAKNAANADELLVRIDPGLAALKVSALPLRERVRVAFDKEGALRVDTELLTPEGEAVPEELVAASAGTDASAEWVQVSGRAYRLPARAAPFRLPQSRKLEGDEIADFLQEELPKLKAAGAVLEKNVEAATVAGTLKPAVKIEPGDGNESIRAQLLFEIESVSPTADAGGTPTLRSTAPRLSPTADGAETAPRRLGFTPDEVLKAAAEGKRYLRSGNTFVKVDKEAVRRCKKELEQIVEQHGDANGALEVEGQDVPELLNWARKAVSHVVSPWNIYVAEAVDGAHKIQDAPANVRFSMDVEEEDDGAWFTLNASFDHDGEALSEDDLRKLVRQGKKWLRKGDKWVKVDAAALETFELNVQQSGIKRRFGRRRKFYYRFRPAERDRVTDIFSVSGTMQHAENYRRFIAQLKGFERIEPITLPKGFALTLRPYQQQGFEWLVFLARYGLNGILADDMGLGKTAQTIALLTQMKDESGAQPNLIVTPTSLVDNWKNEITKFSPTLKVMVYRGSPGRRDRLRQEIAQYDVVLGTYATVRNDATLMNQIDWRHVILDEAHFIKNSAAATTKAIKTIPARHRLALTGTPIQNRLTELWSLFDFLMPEFLGRQMRFRETYEDPIAKMQSGRAESQDEHKTGEEALERLKERIRPFVLRRLKTDVASELPPKIENDIFCNLSPEQVGLYKSFGDSAEAKEAVNELVSKGADRACTAILAALMSLRKICNHADLMLLPKNEGRQHFKEPLPGYEARSGKLEALGELLQQCREGGHRALIFCQLTTMLDLLGHYLKGLGMNYLRLDGETPSSMRQELVNRFNNDTGLDAFLISTRAGGTGLNLTGADTVIFYDHDWNPANDSQAQDRAYRIGQKRTVNVYRLICKGTLEEKILRRQALKKLLASSIVQHDAAGVKDLSREELLSLFTLSEG